MEALLSKRTLPLGFGCSGLLGPLTRRESLKLLETALECGITYFDTARMYGAGGAEGILGEIAPRIRDRIILTSKAGILPGKRPILSEAIYQGLRSLYKAVPRFNNSVVDGLKKYVPAPQGGKPTLGVFDIAQLRKSLETSLKELRTDYLDIFLLHECFAADVAKPELLAFLQSLQREGKIAEFGLATGIEQTLAIVDDSPDAFRVIQIANSVWERNIGRVPKSEKALTITHSCLGNRFHALANRLSTDRDVMAGWLSMTGVDPGSKQAVAQLLLAHALRENPGGIVLVSSARPANVRASAKVAHERMFDDAQLDGLVQFISKYG
jgi:D-threo-aldose 1-dehydrogenase